MLSEDTMKLLPLSRHVVKMALDKLDFENIDFSTSLKTSTEDDGMSASFTDIRKCTSFCANNLADILQVSTHHPRIQYMVLVT